MHPFHAPKGFFLPAILAFVSFLVGEFRAVAQTDPPCTDFTIQLETQMWGNEVSWNLVSTDGAVVASGSATTNYETVVESVCLAYGCYQLEMVDSFGDGWNGATWSISGPAPDGTGTTGVDGLTFSVGHSATQTESAATKSITTPKPCTACVPTANRVKSRVTSMAGAAACKVVVALTWRGKVTAAKGVL